jgi:DnaJ-class molecular chaperone
MGLPELEKKCWKCWGTGVVYVEDHTDAAECPECEGTGWVVTEDGRRLLDFVERHLAITAYDQDEEY